MLDKTITTSLTPRKWMESYIKIDYKGKKNLNLIDYEENNVRVTLVPIKFRMTISVFGQL